MTAISQATPNLSNAVAAVLDVLARAAKGRSFTAGRVVATTDTFDPDEGLALLDAYVGIADASVRQAVLDIVLAITEASPRRRTRA